MKLMMRFYAVHVYGAKLIHNNNIIKQNM